MNSCTICLKLVVSVVSTVVGARREARVRFFGFLIILGCGGGARGARPSEEDGPGNGGVGIDCVVDCNEDDEFPRLENP